MLAAGMGWLVRLVPDGSFVVDVLPASLVAALGMSLAFIPSLGTAISSARPEEGGLAAGIVNTSYQIGSALGSGRDDRRAASYGPDEIGNVTVLIDGFSAAFLGAVGIAAPGVLLAAVLLRGPDARNNDPVPADEPAIAARSR